MPLFWSSAFRRLWCSSLTAAMAQGMQRTLLAWVALETGGDAFAVGLIFAVQMLPSLLLGLAAGTIADRSDRPRQLLGVAGAALLLMAAFAGLIATGALQFWQVVLFAFAAGCVQVFDTPARQALVLDTVPRQAAPRALALIALAARVAGALGALGAGVLIPTLGVAAAFLLVAGAHGLTALLVATVRPPAEHRAATATPPPFRQALREAARLIVDVPMVRTLIAAGLTCEIFAFSHATALPVFSRQVLLAGPEGLGMLNAAAAIGGAVAVVLLSLLPARVGRQPLLGAIFLLYGLAIMALAATRDLAAAAAVVVVIGCCAGAFDVLQQTLIQLAVPDAQRGRAVGVWVLGLGSAPVGHLEMGLLAAALGAPAALLINGALTVTAAATLLARAPGYRWWPRARPDQP